MSMFRPGCTVERYIEGMWFAAVVEYADSKDESVTLKYIDDGNIEDCVPFDEIRMADCKLPSNNDRDNEDNDCIHSPARQKSSSAPKPLAGFLEDDYELRNAQLPTVIVHSDRAEELDSEEPIIISGAQSKLAVGNGLKALRYLKRESKV